MAIELLHQFMSSSENLLLIVSLNQAEIDIQQVVNICFFVRLVFID